jgi:hypothetical protein
MEMAKEPKKIDDLFHDALMKDICSAKKKTVAGTGPREPAGAGLLPHRREAAGQVLCGDRRRHRRGCRHHGGVRGVAGPACLLAAAQTVEHYEISRNGTLRTGGELGLDEAVTLLDTTLKEEKATDVALNELAEAAVNQEAEEIAARVRLRDHPYP